jgi:hypothetical protein
MDNWTVTPTSENLRQAFTYPDFDDDEIIASNDAEQGHSRSLSNPTAVGRRGIELWDACLQRERSL